MSQPKSYATAPEDRISFGQRLIYGLGIRHIGERAAQVLAEAFGSVAALTAASVEQLQATPEIGPVLAEAVRSWFDEPRNQRLLDRLGAAPSRALFVGDSPHDMHAGRAAGVTTAAALWGPFSREELDVAAPDHWLQGFHELPELLTRL